MAGALERTKRPKGNPGKHVREALKPVLCDSKREQRAKHKQGVVSGYETREREQSRAYELHAKQGREEAKAKVDATHVGMPARMVVSKGRHSIHTERVIIIAGESGLWGRRRGDASLSKGRGKGVLRERRTHTGLSD